MTESKLNMSNTMKRQQLTENNLNMTDRKKNKRWRKQIEHAKQKGQELTESRHDPKRTGEDRADMTQKGQERTEQT